MAPECEATKTCGLHGNYSPNHEAYPACHAQSMEDINALDAELEAMLQSPQGLKALVEVVHESDLGLCRFDDGSWGIYKAPSTIKDRLLIIGEILLGATVLSTLGYVFRSSIADGFRSAVDGIKNFFNFNEANSMEQLRQVQNRVDEVDRNPLIYEANRPARTAEIKRILEENPEKLADLIRRTLGVEGSKAKNASVEHMSGVKGFAEKEAVRMPDVDSFAKGEAVRIEQTQRLSESGIRLTPEGVERMKTEARVREARGK